MVHPLHHAIGGFGINGGGGSRGGLEGATAPYLKHLAPCQKKFAVSVGGNLAK